MGTYVQLHNDVKGNWKMLFVFNSIVYSSNFNFATHTTP